MKKLCSFIVSFLLFATLIRPAAAATVSGFVVCDANQNQVIDSNDIGIGNVHVVVTNQNASFSNSTITAVDGSFSLQIPNFDPLAARRDPLSQVYVETLDAATVPAGSTILFPVAITYISLTPAYYIDFTPDFTNVTYTSATGTSSNGDWLIENPDCQSSGNCRINGGGIVRNGTSKKPDHTFNGTIFSSATGGGGGKWTDVAHALNLQFRSTAIQTVTCGTAIDVTGTGILKGTGGNKTSFNPVNFTLRLEDNGKPGKNTDRYYLRVYTSDGVTRVLVSGDPSNPANIVTVPISAGDLQAQ